MVVVVTKENKGRAARRRLLWMGLGCLCTVLTVLIVMLIVFQVVTTTVQTLRHQRYQQQPLSSELRRSEFRQRWMQQKGLQQQQDQKDPLEKEVLLQQMLQGHLQLIDVVPRMDAIAKAAASSSTELLSHKNHYPGLLRGSFCHLDWSTHEQDPSQTPMFRDVVAYSGCNSNNNNNGNVHTMDLYEVVQAARMYDEKAAAQQHEQQEAPPQVRAVPLAGAVFHESRCGSTLLANLLQLHAPDENLVYSESAPPIAILRVAVQETDNTNNLLVPRAWSTQWLQDVVYLMSRTAQTHKQRVFFKIQSIGTLSWPVFRQAFANTPLVFVYRDPTEVLMSHLEQAGPNANCVRSQHLATVPQPIVNVVQRLTPQVKSPHNLAVPDYCAAHLATLTEMAVQQLQQGDKAVAPAVPVNYNQLPGLFTHYILPQLWNVTVTPAALARMTAGSAHYSKGRGGHKQQEPFASDSQDKQQHATAALRRAAQTYLQPSFDALEQLAQPHVTAYQAQQQQQREQQAEQQEEH